MAGTKEIRLKIKSVQNTRKITKAMEMVAASKMRKAQERMRNARPYGDKIRNIAAHLATANPKGFQPMNVTYGLFPPLEGRHRKRADRRLGMAERALEELAPWWQQVQQLLPERAA